MKKKQAKKWVPITVRFYAEVAKFISVEAKKRRRSKNALINDIVIKEKEQVRQ